MYFQAEIVRKKGKNLLSDPIFNKVISIISDLHLNEIRYSLSTEKMWLKSFLQGSWLSKNRERQTWNQGPGSSQHVRSSVTSFYSNFCNLHCAMNKGNKSLSFLLVMMARLNMAHAQYFFVIWVVINLVGQLIVSYQLTRLKMAHCCCAILICNLGGD